MIACALLAGVDPPVFPDTEPAIPDLKARIATAMAFIGDLQPAQINGSAEKEVVLPLEMGRSEILPANRCC